MHIDPTDLTLTLIRYYISTVCLAFPLVELRHVSHVQLQESYLSVSRCGEVEVQ